MNDTTKITKKPRRVVDTKPVEVIYRKRLPNESLAEYQVFRDKYNLYEDDLIRYEKYLQNQERGDEKNAKLSIDISPVLLKTFQNKIIEKTNSKRMVSAIVKDFIMKYNNDNIIDTAKHEAVLEELKQIKSKKNISNGLSVVVDNNENERLNALIIEQQTTIDTLKNTSIAQTATSNDPFLKVENERLKSELEKLNTKFSGYKDTAIEMGYDNVVDFVEFSCDIQKEILDNKGKELKGGN